MRATNVRSFASLVLSALLAFAFAFAFAFVLTPAGASAAPPPIDPIQWSADLQTRSLPPDGKSEIRIEASIEPGWHLYSATQGPGGPIPTSIVLLGKGPLEKAGELRQSHFSSVQDPVFHVAVESFTDQATFFLPVKVAAGSTSGEKAAEVGVSFQACNGRTCLAPAQKVLRVAFTLAPARPGSGGSVSGALSATVPRSESAAGEEARTDSAGAPAGTSSKMGCPARNQSIRDFYEDLAFLQRSDRDEYGKRMPCIAPFLEGKTPVGEDVYYTAILWNRLDAFRHEEKHVTAVAQGMESYLATPGAHRFEESALAHLVSALSSLKRFDEAMSRFEELRKKYHRDSAPDEQYSDVTNVESAGGSLTRALGEAHLYKELETVARNLLAYQEERNTELSWRIGSGASPLLEALEGQNKTAEAAAARKELADYFAERDKFPAVAEMWLASKRIESLEKKDPARALEILEKARDAYKKIGFGRIADETAVRLKLYNNAAPLLQGDVWVNSPALSLDKLRGKVVLLDFWQSWCMPCREGFPALEALSKKRAKDGLVVISVTENDGWVLTAEGTTIGRGAGKKLTWDQEVSQLRTFLQAFHLTMPVAIGRRPADPANPYANAPMDTRYGVNSFPKSILIDREGVVRFVGSPEDPDYLPAIEHALARKAGSSAAALKSPRPRA